MRLELVGRIELGVVYRFLLFGAFRPGLIIPVYLVLSFVFHLVLSGLNELTVTFLFRLDALRGAVVLPHCRLVHLRGVLEVLVSRCILVLSEVSRGLVVCLGRWGVLELLVVCHKVLNLG